MTFGAFMGAVLEETPFPTTLFYFTSFKKLMGSRRQIHEHLGATINQITNKSPSRSFRIPFPEDGAEQRAIATALLDVDALIGALDSSSQRTATSNRPPCSSFSPARPACRGLVGSGR